MALHDDAARILAEYEQLALAGTMESRASIIHRTGLGWGRFLEAHAYMIRTGMLATAQLAIRYDQRTRLWTAGAERHNGAAGYDESKDYLRWHGLYLKTRLTTSDAHLEAVSQAFPAMRRKLKPTTIHRYLNNAVAELEDAMGAL